MTSEKCAGCRRERGYRLSQTGFRLDLLSLAASVAQAQTAAAPPLDETLTWHGITLYGIVDIGLQNQTHGAPISDYFVGGSAEIVQKNSNRSVTGVTPSNLSNSRIGLQGIEPLVGDWSGVFKLETFFNPQSGQIADALKSLAQNNGRLPGNQNTNVDSSASGQTFIQSYAGFSSKTFGTITFGRQNTVLADGIAKYDPNYASQAFSFIGISGGPAGGGDTQNRRLDSSVKYVGSFKPAEGVGPICRPSTNSTSPPAAPIRPTRCLSAGISRASRPMCTTPRSRMRWRWPRTQRAVNVSTPLHERLCPDPAAAGGTCIAASPSNSLAATISDNTAYAFMGLYNMGVLKFFGGYEHIQFANPDTPLRAGFDVAAYRVAYVNVQSGPKSTFLNDKTLQVYWGGVRYTVIPELDLVGAYYGISRTRTAPAPMPAVPPTSPEPAAATRTSSRSTPISLSKRFDAFVGVMYSGVRDGLANGFPSTRPTSPLRSVCDSSSDLEERTQSASWPAAMRSTR